MNFRLIYLLSGIAFQFLSGSVLSQDLYIFSNDRFSGISTVGISPTQNFLNPNGWDVHLLSENAFFQNSYGYISKTSVLGITDGEISAASLSHNITGENTKKVGDYFNHNQTGYHLSNEIMGPSVSFNLGLAGKDFSVGFFSKQRTQSSIIDVDNYLQFTNQEIIEPVLFNLNPFETQFMNWTEIGVNLATEIPFNSDLQWIAGVNLKYLMAQDALYLQNKKNAVMRRDIQEITLEDGSIANQKNLFVSDFDIEVGYATGYDFGNEKYNFQSQGKGFGLDLGLAFINYGGNDDDYNFKVSANLLDVGVVNFNGFVHHFQGDNFQYTHNPNLDNIEFESPEQYAQIISNELYGNPDQSLVSNEFKIGLPTSLHFNASKNIGVNQYLNLDVIQRFPIFENSLKRSNIVNASYIVNTHKFAYGASVSAYEYKYVQLGGFLRYGPLILGSDNLLPLFIPHKKLHGAHFYIGLKIYPLRNRDIERRSRKPCKC